MREYPVKKMKLQNCRCGRNKEESAPVDAEEWASASILAETASNKPCQISVTNMLKYDILIMLPG